MQLIHCCIAGMLDLCDSIRYNNVLGIGLARTVLHDFDHSCFIKSLLKVTGLALIHMFIQNC